MHIDESHEHPTAWLEQMVHRVTEARRVEGDLTYNDVQSLLQSAISDKWGGDRIYIWVRDLSDEWVAYELDGPDGCDTYKVGYSIDEGTNVVTFTGEPEKVILKTSYEQVTESLLDRMIGRVREAKGNDDAGGRIFEVDIVAVGTSQNRMRYPESVLTEAASLYEGAKAYDHHRTVEELRTSTINGLVGHYRNVTATPGGLVADLHLLPSAGHTAEALDASIAAQTAGMPPLVGISHDVELDSRPATEGGQPIREATAITRVLSADVVADPSAGGRATRMVAGGIVDDSPTPQPSEEDTVKTLKELLDALREATPEKRAELLTEHASILEGAGFSADDVPTLLGETETTTETETTSETSETETAEPATAGAATESRQTEARHTEATYGRDSLAAYGMISAAVRDLPDGYEAIVRQQLPERFTEAQLVGVVSTINRTAEALEREGLRPTVAHVGEEDRDKRVEKLRATFRGDWQNGYVRISEAYADITGQAYQPMSPEWAHEIVRESWGPVEGRRQSESLDTTSWDQVLADVMHKQLLADYGNSSLNVWRRFCSTSPVLDFRSKKLIRVGGYGTLPTVAESGTYQPLTSPSDEQATLSVAKKGGTEDWTWEMAVNDDLNSLVRIPAALAFAAAITLYREVCGPATGDATGILTANPTIYDSVALFDAAHANTTASTTLGNAGLNTLRQKMRDQAAYGNSVNVLGLTPKFLLVPNELEDLGNQLCNGNRGVPSTTPGASDVPNLHQGLELIVLDSWTDANDYIVVADPAAVPTIEIGFLGGREDPELFANDDPRQGAVFSRDVYTLKIRHVWGSSVVDYRGLQRMTN